MPRGDEFSRITNDVLRDLLRLKACGAHKESGGEHGGGRATSLDLEASGLHGLSAYERRSRGDRSTMVLNLSLKRQHIAVTIEKAALQRSERPNNMQLRLDSGHRRSAEFLNALHTV
jgi:hypothetical protein